MQPNFLLLVPPLLVLILAFYTRRILTSLIIGIITASFIATNFNLIETIKVAFDAFKTKALDLDNIYVFAFLIFLGITLAIITRTGGALALGQKLTKKLKSAKDTKTVSLMLSMVLAIDDYLNCLTSGFVMRPISDQFKIPRIKLSFLVNSMTAPMTILIPVSSWAGMIIRQFTESGISTNLADKPIFYADPLFTYLETIPFIFYSFLMIFSAWFIVRKEISFGLIKIHEDIAEKTGNLFGGKNTLNTQEQKIIKEASLIDFVLPLITLLSGFIIGILYTGNYYLFGGTNNLIDAFRNSNIYPVLFVTGILTLIITLILAISRNKIKINEIIPLCKEGFNLMISAILLIYCAWTFSYILKNMHTGEYLASLLMGNINIQFLPIILFLTTAFVSIIIGSSWGTIALMLPIATEIISQFSNSNLPIDPTTMCILIPSLGAVLSGAVAGNHLSPIADVSIMSSASTGSEHLEHVKGQFMYALPVFFATAIAYLITGFINCQNKLLLFFIPILCGILISFLTLYIAHKLAKRK